MKMAEFISFSTRSCFELDLELDPRFLILSLLLFIINGLSFIYTYFKLDRKRERENLFHSYCTTE